MLSNSVESNIQVCSVDFLSGISSEQKRLIHGTWDNFGKMASWDRNLTFWSDVGEGRGERLRWEIYLAMLVIHE